MDTKVIKCTCKHTQQDQLYGAGRRLANQTSKETAPGKYRYRCTVCGEVK